VIVVIDFNAIEPSVDRIRSEFFGGAYEYVVIDNFLDNDGANAVLTEFPDPVATGVGKSRDYVFAKNKFEKSDLASAGSAMAELREDLLSDRFGSFLKAVTGEDVFVDPGFHGGGMHQGGEGSFLNMHTDFNYHPVKGDWFRNLNILIYFNKDWKEEYGGQLKLVNKHTRECATVDPLFNRCVIMFTRDYTLHGYDRIAFPPEEYRRSIAAYAYSLVGERASDARSTTWYPDEAGYLKRKLGLHWPKLVAIKTKLFGSSTSKNK